MQIANPSFAGHGSEIHDDLDSGTQLMQPSGEVERIEVDDLSSPPADQ